MKKSFVATFLVTIYLCSTGNAIAQQFPSRPIRIVTTEVGGGNDLVGRIIAPELRRSTGQAIVVENRAGANGIIAAQAVLKAPADGYSVLLNATSTWLLPLLADNVPYDPVTDLASVMLVVRQPNILVVGAQVPVRSVKELIDLASAKPDVLNVAVGSGGGSTHLAAELFKYLTGARIASVPYKGTGPAIAALLGGQVQIFFAGSSAAASHIKSGKVRALAITTQQVSPRFPELPTVASAGLDGYESSVVYAIFARGGTPAPIIKQLNLDLAVVMKEAEVRQKLDAAGLDVVASSPEELAETVRSDIARWSKVIKATGIRAE